ncbi:MAG TPA: hypothetical protein IAB03_08735 [Candidatus Gallibacteroides avistercoris]|uniref:Tetratricopeptide repeat protein n=1 Tax=Candidatus Gallibacteroides avistercoris TaxID=2840833 RepID=A0A9D1M8M4_9BACT|nr:hypothetical protein [Candidatus Gallibacteroides avistercoris]
MKFLQVLLVPIFALFLLFPAKAQKGIESGTPFGLGEDSVTCVENLRMFSTYAKNGAFKEAAEFWEKVYAECPASSRNIYLYGVEIIKKQIEEEKDPAKRDALIDRLMEVYDNRIKYFGDDERFPTSWILGNKSRDYIFYRKEEIDARMVYGWLKESVYGQKEASSPDILSYFVQISNRLMKEDTVITAEEFKYNYQLSCDYLDEALARATDGTNAQYIKQIQDILAYVYLSSGVASSDTVQQMLSAQVEIHKQDTAFLKKTISLLQAIKQQELPVYQNAVDYLSALIPSAESFSKRALKAYKENNYSEAISLYEKAYDMVDTAYIKQRAEYLYRIAAIYAVQHDYINARKILMKAIAENPHYGNSYILLAKIYVDDAHNIYPEDAVLQQTVYYLAVDKLEKAKEMDESVTEEADSLINNYSGKFPSEKDIFMHMDLGKGKTITIGGWIQEKTVVR